MHAVILSVWVRFKEAAIQGFQSADSIHAINLITSGLFTVNTMWTDSNVLSKM